MTKIILLQFFPVTKILMSIVKNNFDRNYFREEQEKFNVWVALLNLEATYGTKSQLEETFQEAVKVNEPKNVYMKMADIYAKDSKYMEVRFSFQLQWCKLSLSLWEDEPVYLEEVRGQNGH